MIHTTAVHRAFCRAWSCSPAPSGDEGTHVRVLVHPRPHSSKMLFIFFSASFLMSHLIFQWLLNTKADVSVDP